MEAQSPAAYLSVQRVTLPERVEAYVDRPSLLARCNPVLRRLTAVSAPPGFGKTTLLAEACRQARQRGHLVAWLSSDERDDSSTLLNYLMLSCIKAGLDIAKESVDGDIDTRIALLLRRIKDHGATCVLALDDLQESRAHESVDVLNRIIELAPPNLCLAMAYREQPRRLAVAPRILHGQGLVVMVEELRFTKPEIARFFDTKLSRKELAAVAEASKGWPFALRVQRDLFRDAATRAVAKSLAANWIETNLLRDLSSEDRNLIEGAGIFGRVEEELLDGVLGSGAAGRLMAMPALRGLVDSSDSVPRTLGVHPAICEYCVGKLARESPERLRALHLDAARCLEQRGDIVAAMRHAVEGGDPTLAATMLEDAGAIRFWLRHGILRALDANDALSEDVLAQFPRLALAHCALLAVSGKLDEADRVYAAACARTDDMRRDRKGGSDKALQLDNLVFKGLRSLVGCRSVGDPDVQAVRAACMRLVDHPDFGGRSQAAVKFALSIFDYRRGNFESAIDWSRQARHQDGHYFLMYASLQLGAIAFARGFGSDAARTYHSIRRVAKELGLYESGPAFAHLALTTELELEMNGMLTRPARLAPFAELAKKGAWLDVYVATADTAAELALRKSGPVGPLIELERALDFARRTGRPALRQCLGALSVEMLALAGRLDRADSIWAGEGLPTKVEDCLDRALFGWREREYICRGRLQLLMARRDFAAGEALAEAFVDAADADGLRRSLSWARALAMALAHAAGNTAAAREHLLEYVLLCAETGYARALVRQRQAGLPLLEELAEEELAPALRPARASLIRALQAMGESSRSSAPTTPEDRAIRLSGRELEILHRLDKARDRDIARALAISESGVRYHVRNIFRKLGVNDRRSAAQRALQLGLVLSTS